MPKNKLSDLNDHLFIALERLNDEEASPEKINQEVIRAQAINGIASQIVNNAKVNLHAMRLMAKGDLDFVLVSEAFGFKRIDDKTNQGGVGMSPPH